MKIILAPMDGITDFHVRQLLTAVGGFDLCITEFLRVTDSLFPASVFYQNCPEIDPQRLYHHTLCSHTAAGTPVHIQLLGSHVGYMAENAVKAVELGVKGIDINFGCPAKTVNNHGGGAILLKHPDKLYQLVFAIRQALPHSIPVSAKMRLGYDDSSLFVENGLALEAAGADFITIHARTKQDGYRPPAKWHEVNRLLDKITIPIVMNGEIWNKEDYQQCQLVTQCDDIMLGRGAFARPDLAKQIKSSLLKQDDPLMTWNNVLQILSQYYQAMISYQLIGSQYIAGRLKLWIKWLMASYDEAVDLFEQIKRMTEAQLIDQKIRKGMENNYD
jgi:tRNA-dihydrouridine synthase C